MFAPHVLDAGAFVAPFAPMLDFVGRALLVTAARVELGFALDAVVLTVTSGVDFSVLVTLDTGLTLVAKVELFWADEVAELVGVFELVSSEFVLVEGLSPLDLGAISMQKEPRTTNTGRILSWRRVVCRDGQAQSS